MNRTQSFLEENQEMQVTIADGTGYNLKTVINDDYRAVNGQFLQGVWSDGMPKEFFDLSRVYAVNIKNGTDIDTKNIGVQAENLEAGPAVGLLREVIKNHLKVEDYATLFNRVRDNLVDFGHVILKKTSEGAKSVDLRNVVRPPHILDIQKSGILEKHEWTWEDMLKRKHKWENWDQVEALWEKMKTQGMATFLVYEHWLIDEFDGQTTKGVVYYLDRELLEPRDEHDRSEWEPIVELARDKTSWTRPITNKAKKKALEKEGFLIGGEEPLYPYQDIRLVELAGRWKGAGVYEITAPIRRAYLRTINAKLRYDENLLKGTFVHTKGVRGKSLTQSAINALETTGVVELQNGASLEQLKFQSITGEFIASADKFFEFGRQLLGLTAQGTGEDLPASMPATVAAINQARAKTMFDAVLEIQGIAWKNWFSNFELQDVMDNLDFNDWVKIQGSEDDLIEVIEPFSENYLKTNKRLVDMQNLAKELGVDIANSLKTLKMELTEGNIVNGSAFVEFKKKFVKNAKWFIEFYITNEAFDKQARINELQNLRQEALTNPASSLSPEKLEAEILNNMDQDPKRFKKSEKEEEIINNPLLNATLPPQASPQMAPEAVPAPQQG